jgi:monothiol glutaredoxin
VTDTNENPVHAFIAATVAENPVVLFMKGTPDAPRCGFSAVTVQILDHVGASFVGVDVLQDEALRDGIKTFTDWPTIPQLYVKGEFVGGSDIVREMFQSGELQQALTEKGVVLGEA